MTTEIPEVAERLAREFADVAPRAVMEAVCSSAGECGEDASSLFVEPASCAETTPPQSCFLKPRSYVQRDQRPMCILMQTCRCASR